MVVRSSSCFSGDFAGPGLHQERHQRGLAPAPWTWVRQVHGTHVAVVEEAGGCRGAVADAAVTAVAGAALAVITADCAPVALSSTEGVVGVVHAGWRGLVAGVVEATVSAMERLGAREIFAALGPCIWPHGYDFSLPDLDSVADKLGPGVRAVSSSGKPALDVPAAVAAALARSGASLVAVSQTCTHCSRAHWSWRARGERGRQATVVWREPRPAS